MPHLLQAGHRVIHCALDQYTSIPPINRHVSKPGERAQISGDLTGLGDRELSHESLHGDTLIIEDVETVDRRDRVTRLEGDDPRRIVRIVEAAANLSSYAAIPSLRADSAPAESFNAMLKIEFAYRHRFATRTETRLRVATWIAGSYNIRRRHSAAEGLPPIVDEQRIAAVRAAGGARRREVIAA